MGEQLVGIAYIHSARTFVGKTGFGLCQNTACASVYATTRARVVYATYNCIRTEI